MRTIFLLSTLVIFFSSCGNKSGTGTSFCDTTCSNDTIRFEAGGEFEQRLTIGMKNCNADTVAWTHNKVLADRRILLNEFLNKNVKLNKSAVKAAFQDTSVVWLSFNDCITGRGYLLKLPYSSSQTTQKITGALNSFDPKFSVDPDLRAYTDRGNLYVVDVTNGKTAQMTFRGEYEMDFDDIHKSIDTINITRQRIFAKLLKEGKEVPFEKKIEL